MKRIQAFTAAALFYAAAALPALALPPEDQPGRPAEQMQSGRQADTHQQVSGRVSDINQSKGLVTLAASAGTIKLHFPPAALRDIKKGDTIIADYAMAEPGTKRAYDAPQGIGEHQMAGTISSIDHDTGAVQVKTAETTLELMFPPQAVRNLKQGDAVTVNMAFSKGS